MSGQNARRRTGISEAIIEVIRGERAARRWSREELARVSGVPAPTLRRLEEGRPPDVSQAAMIARAYGWTLSDLVERAEDRMTSEDEPRANRQSRLG